MAEQLKRREFIKRGVVGLGLLSAPALTYGLYRGYEAIRNREESLEEVVQEIKKFEVGIGSSSLSFEEAGEYAPLVAKLFAKSTRSKKSAEELAKDTYIIRGKPKEVSDTIIIDLSPNEEPFLHDAVQQFKRDYPNVDVDYDMASVIANHSEHVSGIFWNGKTFIVIGNSNPPEADGLFHQYTGKGPRASCNAITPVVATRSRLLHEYTHAEGETEIVPLEDSFFRANFGGGRGPSIVTEKKVTFGGEEKTVLAVSYKDAPDIDNSYLMNGHKSNFSIHYTVHWLKENYTFTQTRSDFNEFVTDYLGTRVSVMHGLPYTVAPYGSPHFYSNFDALLDQSGITSEQLFNLYRNSQLVEFYSKVADGAQNIQFSSEAEKLAFSRKRIDPSSTSPFWHEPGYFTSYYPNVSEDVHTFIDPAIYDRVHSGRNNAPILGCIR